MSVYCQTAHTLCNSCTKLACCTTVDRKAQGLVIEKNDKYFSAVERTL